MSKRESIIGDFVWRALIVAGQKKQGIWRGLVTVKEVADEAGLSKPTVRKYLDKLVELGAIEGGKKDHLMTVQYKIRLED